MHKDVQVLVAKLVNWLKSGAKPEEYLSLFERTYTLFHNNDELWSKMYWVLLDFVHPLDKDYLYKIIVKPRYAPDDVKEIIENFFDDYSVSDDSIGYFDSKVELNLEISTACNLRCSFCSYSTVVGEGKRQVGFMSLQNAKKLLIQTRLFLTMAGVPSFRVIFSPTGLGEPFLNKDWEKITEAVRSIFPFAVIKIHTNGLLLSNDVIERISRSEINLIIVSLRYFDRFIYQKMTGNDYASIVHDNAGRLRRRLAGGPITVNFQYFEVEENNFDDIIQFWARRFYDVKDNFSIMKQDFLHLCDREVKEATDISPCLQLWQVLSISVDGDWYPCCLALWDDMKNTFSISSKGDRYGEIMMNLELIRERHLDGKFGPCLKCAALFDQRKANLSFSDTLQQLIGASKQKRVQCCYPNDIYRAIIGR